MRIDSRAPFVAEHQNQVPNSKQGGKWLSSFCVCVIRVLSNIQHYIYKLTSTRTKGNVNNSSVCWRFQHNLLQHVQQHCTYCMTNKGHVWVGRVWNLALANFLLTDQEEEEKKNKKQELDIDACYMLCKKSVVDLCVVNLVWKTKRWKSRLRGESF